MGFLVISVFLPEECRDFILELRDRDQRFLFGVHVELQSFLEDAVGLDSENEVKVFGHHRGRLADHVVEVAQEDFEDKEGDTED